MLDHRPKGLRVHYEEAHLFVSTAALDGCIDATGIWPSPFGPWAKGLQPPCMDSRLEWGQHSQTGKAIPLTHIHTEKANFLQLMYVTSRIQGQNFVLEMKEVSAKRWHLFIWSSSPQRTQYPFSVHFPHYTVSYSAMNSKHLVECTAGRCSLNGLSSIHSFNTCLLNTYYAINALLSI